MKSFAFLFGQSCLCITFTSWSTQSFGMLLSKLSNRNTHVCTSSVNCSQVAMFQIMPTLCPHGQGVGGGEGWSTKCGQAWSRGGDPKNSQICAGILYGWPLGVFGLEDVDFLAFTWHRTRSLFWGWPVGWLIESSCSFIHLFPREFIFRWPTITFFGFLNRNDLDLCWFSLSSFSLSSSILKWLRDAKLFRSLFSNVLSFAVFLVKRIFHFNYYRYYFYFDLACVKLLQFCDVLWRSGDGFVDFVVLLASLGEINGFSVLGIGMEIVGE